MVELVFGHVLRSLFGGAVAEAIQAKATLAVLVALAVALALHY